MALFKMKYSAQNKIYLEFIKDIYEVSSHLSIKTYVWGGFTQDILEGMFLREHGDLDCFTQNMIENLDELKSQYKNHGYITEFNSAINMLVIKKKGLHASFNSINVNNSVAMWRHIGDQGTIYFPYYWLDNKPREFYGEMVYTSGIMFEYAFRSNIERLNPEWEIREKDIRAKRYFEHEIFKTGIDINIISENFWSYNPFWISKGYDPFKEPVLVCPLKR